jgi:hypothetical protein
MPIGTGYVVVPTRTLPIVIAPVDGIAAGNIILPGVTLGGQILNSPYTDSNGIAWTLNEAITGWDAPDVRVTQTPKGNDDGLFNEASFYGGRQLIAKGTFATSNGNANALMAARTQLRASVNIMGTSLAPFVVAEAQPKMCMVKRMPGYKDRPVSPVEMEFEIHLLAPDPRKYDPFPSTAVVPANVSAVIVTNQGDYESRPILTVRGPCIGINLLNNTTGQNLGFFQTLSSSDVFVIDIAAKAAWLNGVTATYTIASAPSQWWRLVPGANAIQFLTSGSGTLTVSYSSAWIS